MITDARNSGVPICNDQSGAGYYIAETVEEIEIQQKMLMSRVNKITKLMHSLNKAKEKIEDGDDIFCGTAYPKIVRQPEQ